MKKILVIIAISVPLFFHACSSSETDSGSTATDEQADMKSDAEESEEDFSKGIGKFKDVQLESTLNAELSATGLEVYDLKCAACHRLEGDRLVGPSWKGVTEKREPEWILNFITNVDEMLDKDPVAMAQLEECLVRMPNQNLSDEEAFAVLEFMRENDGLK
jgi:mono/diheme cytochrome c family protein